MTRYLIQPRDRILVKVMDFCLLLKDVNNNIGNNISENSSSKYAERILDYAK